MKESNTVEGKSFGRRTDYCAKRGLEVMLRGTAAWRWDGGLGSAVEDERTWHD